VSRGGMPVELNQIGDLLHSCRGSLSSDPAPEHSRNVVFELSGSQRHSFATPTGFPSFLPLSPTVPQTA
jgi:hypothetical protein